MLGTGLSKARLKQTFKDLHAAGYRHVDVELTFGAQLTHAGQQTVVSLARSHGLTAGLIVDPARLLDREDPFHLASDQEHLTVWSPEGWIAGVGDRLVDLAGPLSQLRLVYPAGVYEQTHDPSLKALLTAIPNLHVQFVADANVSLDVSAGLAVEHMHRLGHPRVSLAGFPVCLTNQSVRTEDKRVWTGKLNEEDFLGAEFVKPPACSGCVHYLRCPGVRGDLVSQLGDQHLVPTFGDLKAQTTGLLGVPIIRDASGVVETERVDISSKYPDTVLMTLIVPACDLNCVFCDGPQDDVGLTPSTRRGVLASLRALASRVSGVFFTGGEPTQVPWLLEAIAFARAQGIERVQMQSHAGRASEPAFADKLVGAGLTAIDVPFYGPDATTHEAITATPGSFERTLKGLRMLQSRGVYGVAHVTLFESNLPKLRETLQFLDGLGLEGIYTQITGEVGLPGTYEAVAPSSETVAHALRAALDEHPLRTPLTISDIPVCVAGDLAPHLASSQTEPRRGAKGVVLPYSEWLATFSSGATRRFGRPCEACSGKDSCYGVSREVLRHFGDDWMQPRVAP